MPEQFIWTFDEAAARAWLAAEAAKDDTFDYYLDEGFNARDSDATSSLAEIVSLAQMKGWLTCSANTEEFNRTSVWLDYDRNEDGGYLSWYVDFFLPDATDVTGRRNVTVFAGGCDPWKVGDPDTVGIDGVISVITDTLAFANQAARDLINFTDVWQRGPQPIAAHYTDEQLRQVMDENGYITAVIAVDVDELIDATIDAVNERLSEEVTGDPTALTDIGYEVVGYTGTLTLLLEVVGNVEMYLEERDSQ